MRIHILVTDEKGVTYEGTVELTKTKPSASIGGKTHQPPRIIRKAPQAIHALYLTHYFKENKPLDTIIEKLGAMRYNFKKHTVEMALQRAKYLTNTGNNNYVEKYPPT
ncbi:hypothetical protein NVIE_000780 [Nitrososphaera viennensis EN76]|uniref:Uncharacterized protein n=2 Tax=Nitrososphaera viennensis TaxID=1034015 RepID=A0A060HKZ6_9ARCH|nr:hypothetical protein NVIE_000780 [Nitrososphaera viennensis EN76]